MEISLVCYPFQETLTIHGLRLAAKCAAHATEPPLRHNTLRSRVVTAVIGRTELGSKRSSTSI